MITNDYQCVGQMNIWDYLSSTTTCDHSGHTCNKKELWKVADSLDELQCPHVCCRKCNTKMCGARCNGSEEPMPKAEPDDSICEGCKWREHKDRELNVDEYGQTWVYRCPGTACMNWKTGTPLNLTAQKPDHQEVIWYEPEEVIYCFNRDFLPPLEKVVEIMTDWFGIKFKKTEFEYKGEVTNTVYQYKRGKSVIELDEGIYSGGAYEGRRFIGVSWNAPKEGTAGGSLNLWEVERALQRALQRAEEYKNKKVKKEDDDAEG